MKIDTRRQIDERKIIIGGDLMCLVEGSSVDIESGDLEYVEYKCEDCSSKFKAIGKRVRCPTCESSKVKKIS